MVRKMLKRLVVTGLVAIISILASTVAAAEPPVLDGDWNVALTITKAVNASPPVGTEGTRLWKFTPQDDGIVKLERQRLTSDSFTTYFLTPVENSRAGSSSEASPYPSPTASISRMALSSFRTG